jgi:hypothetical protein
MMATSRETLLESIAEVIADYREGEVSRPTPAHVARWIGQFPEDVQDAMLAELHHVFKSTYISRKSFDSFLRGLAKNKKFTGDDPAAFWRRAHLLDIQQGGTSQREMLALFREIIKDEYGTEVNGAGPYVYIDDAIFSGTRVKCDLADWMRQHAPAEAEVRVVAAALHTGGEYYATKELKKVIKDTGKKITLAWWHCIMPENRKAYRNSSDVLWPTALPDDPNVAAYAKYLEDNKYPAVLREPGSIGDRKFFSSGEQRILLEQQLLISCAQYMHQHAGGTTPPRLHRPEDSGLRIGHRDVPQLPEYLPASVLGRRPLVSVVSEKHQQRRVHETPAGVVST